MDSTPGPATPSHRNRARYSNSSNPSSVSSESTSPHLAARMATIMVTPKAPAEIRVSNPSNRNRPPKNSIPEVSGVKKPGNGIPQPMKFSVTCGKLLSLPQPLQRNTQPTVIRANSGASHRRWAATRSGQPMSQSINCRMRVSETWVLDRVRSALWHAWTRRRTRGRSRAAHSEFICEPHAKYPRPSDRLRGNELRARGEYALDHIGQVLGVQLRRPRALRDTERCIVLSERGIFEPEVCRAHVPTGGDRGVTAGLGEGMAGMRGAGLCEGIVRVHRPLVAQTQVELQRRRIGAGAADRTVRILNAEDGLSVFGLGRRVRQQCGIIGDQVGRVGLFTAVPGSPSLRRQALGNHCDKRRFHTANPIVRSIRGESDIAEFPRVKKVDLHIVPVFLIDRPVPLQAVIEELCFPAELVVGQIVGC